MGVVTITIPTPASISVSGAVKNCSLSSVTNGFVDIVLDGSVHRTAINNGNFSITIDRCSNAASTAQIIATDVQANQQSTSTPLNVTSGSYSTGDIIACGVSTQQYINYTIGSRILNFVSPADSFLVSRQDTNTTIQAFPIVYTDSASWNWTQIRFSGAAAPGTYILPASSFYVQKGITPAAGTWEYALVSSVTVTITEYGGPGQYIAGSFTGLMRDWATSATTNGTCNFRVRRGL